MNNEKISRSGYYIIQKNNETPYKVPNLILDHYLYALASLFGNSPSAIATPPVIHRMAIGYSDQPVLPNDARLYNEKLSKIFQPSQIIINGFNVNTSAAFDHAEFPAGSVPIREIGVFAKQPGDTGNQSTLLVSRINVNENLRTGDTLRVFRTDTFGR